MAKLTNTVISGTLNGFNIGSGSGWFGQIPTIRSNDGVMEVGKYVDFHVTGSSKNDYDGRITAVAGGGELTFPTKSGTIAVAGDLPKVIR